MCSTSKMMFGVSEVVSSLTCIRNWNRGYCFFKKGETYQVSRTVKAPSGDIQYVIDLGESIGEVTVNSSSRVTYFQ